MSSIHLFVDPPGGGVTLETATSFGSVTTDSVMGTVVTVGITGGDGAVYAAMSGKLSARAPGETVLGPIEEPWPAPDGVLPSSITLYLYPMAGRRSFALASAMETAGLSALEAFGYHRLDVAATATILGPMLDAMFSDGSWTFQGTNVADYSQQQKVDLFLAGWFDLYVDGGTRIGTAGPPVNTTATYEMGITVETASGRVDSLHFFHSTESLAENPTAMSAFLAVMPAVWPLLSYAASYSDFQAAATTTLYPYHVLVEAKKRLGITSAQWAAIGRLQKELHVERLRALLDASPPFIGDDGKPARNVVDYFDDGDWRNPFQLWAAVELYLNYPQPRELGSSPPSGSAYDDTRADLLLTSAEPQLVIIDSMAAIGGVEPKEDWEIEGGDSYAGVLFLMSKGEVRARYRWTTYTMKAHGNDGSWLRGSIEGNQKVRFVSLRAGAEGRNFDLHVKDPTHSQQKVRVKFYFDTPPAGGGRSGGTEIHDGQTEYTGSGGCIVSPRFYELRSHLIFVHLEDHPAPLTSPLWKLAGLHSEKGSIALYNADTSGFWGGVIQGDLWIIRPDEPVIP